MFDSCYAIATTFATNVELIFVLDSVNGYKYCIYLLSFRSDIAWKSANYAQIWEYLRDEYELTQRFGSLDFKLKFVEVPCIFSLSLRFLE